MYVMGIEGGGTKSTLWISDERHKVFHQAEGGPININNTLPKQALENLENLISISFHALKLQWSDIAALCIGSAGLGRATEQELVERFILQLGYRGKFKLVSDAEIALAAAVGKAEGIVLIAGTGSIAIGYDRLGNYRRCGGWGYIFGDEGSAYEIGRNVLQAVAQAHDGRGLYTTLLPIVLNHLGKKYPEELIPYFYGNSHKSSIAALAPLAECAAINGDEIAIHILNNTVDSLIKHVVTLVEKMIWSQTIEIVCHGGVLSNNNYVFTQLVLGLRSRYSNIEIKLLDKPAVRGAVNIALELLGGSRC